MQQQSRFDRLVKGEAVPLPEELPALAAHCTALPQQLMPAATALYRHDPQMALRFLRQAAAGADEQKQGKLWGCGTMTAIHACHSALALTAATHTPDAAAQLEGEAMEAALKAETAGGVACGLSRALLHLYRGETAECLKLAKSLEDEMNRQSQTVNKQLTLTQLLLAQCCFARRAYQQALEYYRKSFMRNNWLPIQARLGMAYCYFHLSKYEMAGACAARVLQLSPQSVDAHICLALVCQLGEDHQGYFTHLTAAYQLDPQQPLLLYLVATHLFLRDRLQQAEQLCKKAQDSLKGWAQWLQLKEGMRDDCAELSNRISNLLGQIAHRRKDYAGALEYYGRAAQKGLFWNDLAMAQCLMGLQRHREALDSLSYTYRLYDREKRDWRLLKDSYRMMAYLKVKCRSREGQEGRQALHYYGEAIKFDKNDPLLKEHLCYLLSSLERDNHKALRTMQELHKQLLTPNPESLLNYGVLLMHNHEPEEAEAKLRQALQLIQQWQELDPTQQQGFLLIARYNLAICLQSANSNHAGLQLLEGILAANPLHLNALLHKALLLHKLGNTPAALQSLSTAHSTFQERLVTQGQGDKIRTMEAYLLFIHDQPSAALYILRELVLKKPACLYLKALDFAVRWEVARREGGEEEARVVEEGRQCFEAACAKDNAELFCCMVAGVARAWQGSLGKEQGTNLFKKILVSSSLSCLRYNMALFYMQQQDPDAAISCLNQHREHAPISHQHPALELIAHQYLQGRDYRRCLKAVKRAILMQPASLAHRLQLAVATQSKCEEELASNHPNPSQIRQDHHQIQKCILIYRFCASRTTPAPTKQQCTHNAVTAERLLQRCQAQLRQMGEQAGRADGSESEGEEDRLRRQVEEKKRKALALSKLKAQSMSESWNIISQKQRAAEEDKGGRKRTARDPPTPPNATPPRRRDKRDKRDEAKTEPDDASLKRSKQDAADDESLSRYMVE